MKKRITMAVVLCLLMISVFCLPFYAAAAGEETTTGIVSHNVSYKDSINLVYYVKSANIPEGATEGVLIWSAEAWDQNKGAPAYENAEYRIEEYRSIVDGKKLYYFDQISARQIADDYYAMSFVKTAEGDFTYSAVDKYSILQYCINKKTSDGTMSGGVSQTKDMVAAIRAYGAAAQNYFGYRLDRLATDTFYTVNVVGGALADGTTKGLYKENDTVTITATIPDRETFVRWENSAGQNVGTDETLNVTVEQSNETYTAVFNAGNLVHSYIDGLCECGERDPEYYTVGLTFALLSDGEAYKVTGYAGTSATVVIPSVYNEKPVTEIGNSVFSGKKLVDVYIPNSVTSINSFAFRCCVGLRSITIPDSVTNIEYSAFEECTDLNSVTIGANVTSIASSAFLNCYKLIEVCNLSGLSFTAGRSIYGAEYVKHITTDPKDSCLTTTEDGYIFYEDDTYSYLMGNIGNESALILPDHSPSGKTYAIHSYAFYRRADLTAVTISNNVSGIGNFAFQYCMGLISITIPESVPLSYSYAFRDCYKLIEICNLSGGSIPASVYTNSNGYSSVKQIITDPKDSCLTTTADGYIFYEDDTNSYLMGYAGNGSSALPTLSPAGKSYEIHRYAFYQCTGLTGNLIIPDSVTSISYYAFMGCTGLTSVTIGNGVTNIDDYAFQDCHGLITVTLGGNVSRIGSQVFYNCDKLIEVCNLSELPISTKTVNYGRIGLYAKRIITNPEDSCLTTADGYIFYEDDTNSYLMGYVGSGSSALPTLSPTGKTYEIYKYAFYQSTSLTGNLIIPDSVSSIGENAFENCTDLTGNLIIPATIKNIGQYAFKGCSSLTSITIPQNIWSITFQSFYGCSDLTSITIPNSVMYINMSAFERCNHLTSITFTGTMAQWQAITKGSDWNRGVPYSCIIHCTDGDLSI